MIADLVFWMALFLLVYPYVFYPPLIRFLANRYPLPEGEGEGQQEVPSVTLIISAYNEAAVIRERLENTLSLDYPPERLQIMVVSDASEDDTDEIVREFASRDPRIRLLRQEQRCGKSAGLNRAVAEVESDLLVFSDANAMYEPAALKELVRPFSDPDVGYVVGAQRYRSEGASESQASEGLYWRLELWLKQQESRFCGVVGGDGAIYALRRKLFVPLEEDDLSDFVNPLHAVAQGCRGVFNPAATCWEEAGESFDQEFRRKRRIVNRSWRAVTRYIGRLDPVRDARFLFALVSHKVLRWYATPLTAIALVSGTGPALAGSMMALLAETGLAASVVAALVGHRLAREHRPLPRLVSLAYYFHLASLAAILGILDNARGIRHTTWDHVRSKTQQPKANG